MKQRFVGVKLYLIGLTAGLFVFGWAAVARSDSSTNTAAANPPQASVTQPNTNRSLQPQTQRPTTFRPRIRTRSS